jgi:putative glycosyltransferase (TIGR04372 family)
MIIDRIFHKINSSKSHPYFYLSPLVYGIGNCSDEIYTGLVRVKNSKKKLIILYPFNIPFIFKYKLTNSALFNIKSDLIFDQGKYILMLSRTFMTIIYMPLRILGLLLQKFSKFDLLDSYHFPRIGIRDIYVPEKSLKEFSFGAHRRFNSREKFNGIKDISIKLNGNSCDNYAYRKIGIPKDSWFVCLHVRESGFRGDKGRRDYRNANILNYMPAIKEITSKGGWVVRIGDNTMTPLPSMEKVIDYPFTKFKSDFIDLCLIKNCLFYIGSQSGPYEVAKLFHKNVLLINSFTWGLDPYGPKDRGILKHVYSKKERRYLSIKELLAKDCETKVAEPFHNGFLDENDYMRVENSEGEISRAVLEYMDFLNNKDLSLTSKQKKFLDYSKTQVRRWLEHTLTSTGTQTDNDIIDFHRVAARMEAAQGTLCAGFLEENW